MLATEKACAASGSGCALGESVGGERGESREFKGVAGKGRDVLDLLGSVLAKLCTHCVRALFP